MGSVDEVAIMCTIGLDLAGDGGYVESSDDEAAPSGCWVPDQADMRAEEDAAVNAIFIRWRNVLRYPVPQIGEPEGWMFDGYPIHSMLDMYAHGIAHELVHCMINACCSLDAQKRIDAAGRHSEVFQCLSGNTFGHMHCEGEGSGCHLSGQTLSS